MTRTTAHLISHTHWDREWYMPYERHHVLLAKLMNEPAGDAGAGRALPVFPPGRTDHYY